MFIAFTGLPVYSVKPVLIAATSIKQAACIEQACIHFPKEAIKIYNEIYLY